VQALYPEKRADANNRLAGSIKSGLNQHIEGKSPQLALAITATSLTSNGFRQRWLDLGLCVYQD